MSTLPSYTKRKTLCIDFDGVLHSYTSPWANAAKIPDPPVKGAIEWLTQLTENPDYQVCIYSSRSKDEGGIHAMKKWLLSNGFDEELANKIEFPMMKPPAWLTIDDRAICFRGTFPSQLEIDTFRPWNK